MRNQDVAEDEAHPCALLKALFHFTLPVPPLRYPCRMGLSIRIMVSFGLGRARDLYIGKCSMQQLLKGPQIPCKQCKPDMYDQLPL